MDRVLRAWAPSAAVAAAVGVFVVGATAEADFGRQVLGAATAAYGAASFMHPRAVFGFDAPRSWFGGPRPEPSKSWLRSQRIGGALLLVFGYAILFIGR